MFNKFSLSNKVKHEPEFDIIEDPNGKKGIESKGGLIIYHPVFDTIIRFKTFNHDFFEEYIYCLGKSGKYGLTEIKGFLEYEVKEYLPIEFDELKQITYDGGLFVIAKKGEKFGLYSRVFKWVLALEYDDMNIITFEDNWSKYQGVKEYLLYKKGDKYGVMFPPYFHMNNVEYDEILPPIDEYGVRVKKNGINGYLNKHKQFTTDLSQVAMEWETLSDIYIDRDTRTLHEINRGKKQIKSDINIPLIQLLF